MIARLIRLIRRRMLESFITDLQDSLASIEKQRQNDEHAKKIIQGELILEQRRLQKMIQDEVNEATALNVRRMRR